MVATVSPPDRRGTMQEKTGARILRDAADHIEANGLLFDAWESEDATEDLPPCCCLYGTLRLVAGLPPTPPKERNDILDAVPGEALIALGTQIEPECIALGWERHGEDGPPLTVMEWADHYADVEVVRRKRRGGKDECCRLDHEDSDRGHVVRVLRQAAERCEP